MKETTPEDPVVPPSEGGSVRAPTVVPVPVPSAGDSSYSPPGTPPETTPPDKSRVEVNPPGNADADEQRRKHRMETQPGKV